MQNADQKVRRILQFAALMTFAIGLTTLLLPNIIVKIFDGDSGENHHFVRFIGTALIGFAVANWLYSRARTLEVMLPAIYGNLTSLTLAIFVDAVGLAAGALSKAAWAILLLHILFAGAFSYSLALIKREL